MIEVVELASRLMLVAGLYVSATLMYYRASDIAAGIDYRLPDHLRLRVARGWCVALFALAIWQTWWLASWVVEAKGGDGIWFRTHDAWLVIPIGVASLGLFYAASPYASKVTPDWKILTTGLFAGAVVMAGFVALYITM